VGYGRLKEKATRTRLGGQHFLSENIGLCPALDFLRKIKNI